MSQSAAPPPSPLAALKKLSLLQSDDARAEFFPAVTEMLSNPHEPAESAMTAISERFGIDFSGSNEQAAALLYAAKLVACRVASSAYAAEGSAAALRDDLAAAGLGAGAATWICESAEAAVLPTAQELRFALAHVAAARSHDYLQDFDWGLHHVLGSSALANVQKPLVSVHLVVAKAGSGGNQVAREEFELDAAQLDATLGVIGAANEAMRALPQPDTKS
jgi:hypothetical protein